MSSVSSSSWFGLLLGAVCLLVVLAIVAGAIVGIVYLLRKPKSNAADVPHPVVSSSVTPPEESPNEPPTPGS
ncbi:MAG: hypothetical protein JXL80_12390 [Planctomycetes bacterium]|nr:hypothetical protein [Planctomycetota bacterium]